jgi:hypothetical protein
MKMLPSLEAGQPSQTASLVQSNIEEGCQYIPLPSNPSRSSILTQRSSPTCHKAAGNRRCRILKIYQGSSLLPTSILFCRRKRVIRKRVVLLTSLVLNYLDFCPRRRMMSLFTSLNQRLAMSQVLATRRLLIVLSRGGGCQAMVKYRWYLTARVVFGIGLLMSAIMLRTDEVAVAGVNTLTDSGAF